MIVLVQPDVAATRPYPVVVHQTHHIDRATLEPRIEHKVVVLVSGQVVFIVETAGLVVHIDRVIGLNIGTSTNIDPVCRTAKVGLARLGAVTGA